MKHYIIRWEDGTYLATVQAETEYDACYALYGEQLDFEAYGTVVDSDADAMFKYVVPGKSNPDTQNFVNYRVTEVGADAVGPNSFVAEED